MEVQTYEKTMVELLGRDAFYSTDYNVTDNVKRLAFAVNYLYTQIGQCQRMMAEEDRGYVDNVKQSVVEILKGERR